MWSVQKLLSLAGRLWGVIEVRGRGVARDEAGEVSSDWLEETLKSPKH